ncbi:MAG: HNH endonuclease [Mycoplasma sp.]|nr:HNH endonuclease [Mycoplasma sp.]
MIKKILNYIKDLSIKNGFKFSDKTWKYDTIYFSVKLFSQYIDNGEKDVINIDKNVKSKIIVGFKELLQLKNTKKATNANNNYFNESLNFLISTNIFRKKDAKTLIVKNKEIFEYIGYSMETAYIFQYLCVYTVFKNDNLWNGYISYCRVNDFEKKTKIYKKIIENIKSFLQINRGTGKWALFVSKFFMMVLGLANGQNRIARTSNISDEKISPKDLANKAGTKTETIKFNDYSDTFNLEQVRSLLKDYLSIKYYDVKNVKPLEHYTINNLSPKLSTKILEIWNDFQKATEMKYGIIDNTYCDLINSSVSDDTKMTYEEIKNVIEIYEEGKITKSITIPYRGRSRELKYAYHEEYGYKCQLCDKLFLKANGKGYIIDIHHLFPIAKGKRITSLKDVKGLCPNCHRFVHSIKDFENKSWDEIVDEYQNNLKK